MSTMPDRLTKFQAIPVSIGDISTEMVLISLADFEAIEHLLDDASNLLAVLSGGIVDVTPGGRGFSLDEAAAVVEEATEVWDRLVDVLLDPYA